MLSGIFRHCRRLLAALIVRTGYRDVEDDAASASGTADTMNDSQDLPLRTKAGGYVSRSAVVGAGTQMQRTRQNTCRRLGSRPLPARLTARHAGLLEAGCVLADVRCARA